MNFELMTAPKARGEIGAQRSGGCCKGLEGVIGKRRVRRLSSPPQHFFKSINAGLQPPGAANVRH